MKKIFLLIIFLFFTRVTGSAQSCDSLNKVVMTFFTQGYGVYDNTCVCEDCFCFYAIFREVSPICFDKYLTITGSKKVSIGKIQVNFEESRKFNEGRNFIYTIVHFEFIPKNKKRALRRLAKDKPLGYDFFIINKHTREVYFRGEL